MKILYVAVSVNHHHVYLVDELYKRWPGEVLFAAKDTYEMRRRKMKFPDMDRSWIMKISDNERLFYSWFMTADVVICHDRSFYQLMRRRIENKKLSFYMSERWCKPPYGKLRLLRPNIFKIWYNFRKMFKTPYFYYLAQGIPAAYDFKSIGLGRGKIFSFGYFPSVEPHDNVMHLLPEGKINILWCGRMLRWKNVDKLVKAFIKVSKIRQSIHLTIIGQGDQERLVRSLVKDSDNITIMPFLPTDVVRSYMSDADIYVFPSSGAEGWGCVLNEAMSEGCAVIGAEEAGAVRSMLQDGVNGLILHNNTISEICDKLLYLIDNKSELSRLKVNALKSIRKDWSPYEASSRLLTVINAINSNQSYNIYKDGVMSCL